MRWRLINNTWCNWPYKPRGLIELIGGSYLAASPQISYRRLLQGLLEQNLAIHAWTYIPTFDHHSLANQAWSSFRKCKKILSERIGYMPNNTRLGHSLGSKLHLIAPDYGRSCNGFISMSFNNYEVARSIPIMHKLKSKFDLYSEFSPNPDETIMHIIEKYSQPRNLLISFDNDKLDQTSILFKSLKHRDIDSSKAITMKGDHLTPASAGLRQKFMGELADNHIKTNRLRELINIIGQWA